MKVDMNSSCKVIVASGGNVQETICSYKIVEGVIRDYHPSVLKQFKKDIKTGHFGYINSRGDIMGVNIIKT